MFLDPLSRITCYKVRRQMWAVPKNVDLVGCKCGQQFPFSCSEPQWLLGTLSAPEGRAGSVVTWQQRDWSNAHGAGLFPFQSLFKSDNLMGPIPVSCGQFHLSPPGRLPGKAEVDSRDAAAPMDSCSLLLPVSQLAPLHTSLLHSRGLPCLWGAWLALEPCAPVMWKLLGARLGVCCDPHGLSAGSEEWQCSRFKEIQVERFKSLQPIIFSMNESTFILTSLNQSTFIHSGAQRPLHIQKQKWKLCVFLKGKKKGSIRWVGEVETRHPGAKWMS